MEELLPEATLSKKGVMSFKDKQKMFKSLPTSGGGLIHVATVKEYTRFGAIIYNIPNNRAKEGMFFLKSGNSGTPMPNLIKLYGDKMAGKIYYKMTGTTMDIYYKSPNIDTGPQDIFQTIIGTPIYTTYTGTIDDMIELAIS